MSRLNVSNLFNENEDGAPSVVGISTFSSPYYFVPPSGTTAQRPQNPGEGMIRFNTDSGHLEYYTGTHWADVIVNNQDLGDQNLTTSARGTGHRAIFAGGNLGTTPNNTDTIDYFTISTLGARQDFGNLSTERRIAGAFASRTRGVIAGGYANPAGPVNLIEYVTIASPGNGTDFGDLTNAPFHLENGMSSETRGIVGGGLVPTNTDVIQYVTIAQTGNAVDFGNLIAAASQVSSCASSIRGIFAGGNAPSAQNVIQYITISTTGDAQNFGDLTSAKISLGGLSSSTRGVFAGGSGEINVIEFLTIATLGNTADFGDLTLGRNAATAASSPTRGLFCGGLASPVYSNVVDYITIATTGNASDFGDLAIGRAEMMGLSNGHGGL